MRVGFYLVGSSPEYRYLGGLAAQVAKQTMPGVKVVHFTDINSPRIPNVDEVKRMPKECPMAVFRMRHHQTPGDWLFIDVDVLVVKNVQNVFDEQFDIAIASRLKNDGAQHDYFAEMPHNMGVVFSRSPEFWAAAEKELLTYEPKMQEWMGDQLAVCRLIKRGGFDTRIVPGEDYNFAPNSLDAGGGASILHFKGPRKNFMAARANELLRLEAVA